MKSGKDYQTGSRVLNTAPIAFFPAYKIIMGTTSGGIVLSQLMFLFGAHGPTIYHQDSQFMRETASTPKELKNAKISLKKLPWLRVFLKGTPARTHYEIDWEAYDKYMRHFAGSKKWSGFLAVQSGESSLVQRTKLALSKGPNYLESNRREKELTLATIPKTSNLDGFSNKQLSDFNKRLPPLSLMKAAKKLKAAVASRINVKINSPARYWASDLYILHTEGDVEISRIVKIVSGFVRNIEDEFMPVVTTGAMFRKKFPQIEYRLKKIAGENEEDSVSGESPGGRTGKITIVDLGDISIAEARRQSWKD